MANKQLQVEIDAQNKLNKVIKDYAPAIFRDTAELVGKLAFKKDRSLRADAAAVVGMPEINNKECMIYLHNNSHSFALTFKVSTWLPHEDKHRSDYCAYAETTVYIANVSDGVIVDMKTFNADDYPSDYTIEGVENARAECKKAEKAYESAKSACEPFGVGR